LLASETLVCFVTSIVSESETGCVFIAAACARVEAAGAVDGTERRPPRLGKPTERVFHKLPHALFSSVKKAKTRNYKTPHRAWAELPTDSAEEASILAAFRGTLLYFLR